MVKQEDLKEILHKADLKITRSRLEVLKILYHTHKPITHTYIMEHLPEKDTWDRVTVYRTLSEFTEKKIIKSLPSNERITYFEIKNEAKPEHSHLVCDSCGKMECFNEDSYKFQFKKNVQDFRVRSLEIIIRGLCKNCQ